MVKMIFGIVLFFGIHSISIISDSLRNRLVDKLGLLPWKTLYSMVALLGLVLIISGYGVHNHSSPLLYRLPSEAGMVTLILMIPVFPLFAAAYLPGRIQKWCRHPMLLGTKIWAFSHLLVSGSVTGILLFGPFLLWAGIVRISLECREARAIPRLPSGRLNDSVALVGGGALYLGFILGLHELLTNHTPM